MPDLTLLPKGASVFVDTNIFDLHFQGRSLALPINEKLLVTTKIERARFYLMTGDSLHLGCMNRRIVNRHKAPLQDIVTYDSDFAHIPGVIAWEPSDVIP